MSRNDKPDHADAAGPVDAATAGMGSGSWIAAAGKRGADLLARLDRGLNRLGRRLAQACPDQLLPIVVLFLGSIVVAWVALPGALALQLRHFVDCWFPGIGPWLMSACADAPPAKTVPLRLVGIGFLLVMIWILGRLFVTFSSRIVGSWLDRVEPGVACTALIMGLSLLPRNVSADDAIAEAKEWSAPDRRRLYAGPAAKWRAEADRAASARAGGWQQAARMVAAHLSKDDRISEDRLKKIYLLPSSETRALFEHFQIYLETLFARTFTIEIVKTEDGHEFEDAGAPTPQQRRSYDNYLYLWNGLRHAVEMAKKDFRKLREDEICIDATAGYKLFSIAAAVVTLDREILLGYVVTRGGDHENPEEGVVKLFDPRLDFLGAAGRKVAQSYLRSPSREAL